MKKFNYLWLRLLAVIILLGVMSILCMCGNTQAKGNSIPNRLIMASDGGGNFPTMYEYRASDGHIYLIGYKYGAGVAIHRLEK